MVLRILVSVYKQKASFNILPNFSLATSEMECDYY